MIEIQRDRLRDLRGSQGAYDRLYTHGHSDWLVKQMASRYIWLVSLLPARRGQRLLDVSCGSGALLQAAMQRGLVAYGVDISTVALQQVRTQLPDAEPVCSDAESLPFADRTFDYVTNIGSIEHYLHPERGVAEMARVLKPDGMALILLPNAYGLLGNVLHVMRHGDVFVDDQPLQRYATRAWWTRLLEDNGLVVFKTVRYERELPRTRADWAWHLRHPIKLVHALIGPLIPLNLADMFVFLCRPRIG